MIDTQTASLKVTGQEPDNEAESLISVHASYFEEQAAKSWVAFHKSGNALACLTGQALWKSGRNQNADELAGALLSEWRKSGPQFLESLSGSFSLILIDGNSALLAVDKFASHPIYLCKSEDRVRFGTHADSFAYEQEPAKQALFNYLYFHAIPGPKTIFDEVKALPPGHYAEIESNVVSYASYWACSYAPARNKEFETLKSEFRGILQQAVADSIADNEVGCFLSGGTDSSTVAGTLSEVLGKPANTYSIGFNAPGYDETEYARLASRHFGTNHNEYYVTPDDVVAAIPMIASACDQPFGNSSIVPAYYCAKMAAADGVTQMLGGDGGDELFGGNTRYATQLLLDRYQLCPKPVREAALEPLALKYSRRQLPFPLNKVVSYINQAKQPMPGRMQSYNLLNRIGIEKLFTAEFLSEVDTDYPLQLQTEVYKSADAKHLLNRMLAWDSRFTLTDNDLPKVMKACAMAGVNVSFPLLDSRLIEFAAALPLELKVSRGKLRVFFKQALEDFLPTEIINKSKHGFGLPFGLWMTEHQGLRDITMDSLSMLGQRDIIRKDFLTELMDEYLPEHPGYYGTLAWVLMMLEQWLQAHDHKSPGASQLAD